MTTLAARPVSNPDELALFADSWTALAKPFAERFREACWAESQSSLDGLINPNEVRRRLMDAPDYNPRQLSALWSASCGPSGFMVKTDVEVPIDPDGSRGNGNKDVVLRRWLG